MARTGADIDFTKQTLELCFASNVYVVPDYQREYVWEEQNVKPLLDDIIQAFNFDPQKLYFVGTIVVNIGPDRYEVIDGQQRLTTFFIMLCALRKLYEDNGLDSTIIQNLLYSTVMNDYGDTVKSFRLELQYQDATGFLEKVFQGKIEENDKRTESTKKIADAYDLVLITLRDEFDKPDMLKRFTAFVLKKILFVQIETSDMSEALKIFETINERGVGLNPMDLLKNLIFMQVEREKFKELNAKWREVTSALEQINEQPLRFLRYYIIANYDTSGLKDGIVREDKVYDWLVNNNDKCHYKEKPFMFVNDMIAGVRKYVSYYNPSDENSGNAHLKNIALLAGKKYKLHLQLLLAAKKMNDAALARFKQLLESIVYYATITRTKTNYLERLFAQWCNSIRGITTVEELNEFVIKSVMPAVDGWKQDYKAIFMNLSIGMVQQYRIRFILGRIERYIDVQRQSQGDAAKDVTGLIGKGVEIEHIMPQTCNDPDRYNVKAEEYDLIKNRLGNLTLLEKSINASIQNDSYDDKCNEYEKSKFYLTQSLKKLVNVGANTAVNKMNERLRSWPEWTGKAVAERQEMLYTLGESIWSINNLL